MKSRVVAPKEHNVLRPTMKREMMTESARVQGKELTVELQKHRRLEREMTIAVRPMGNARETSSSGRKGAKEFRKKMARWSSSQQ